MRNLIILILLVVGITQVNTAVAQMDTTTQENAAFIEEVSANSIKMNEEASHLSNQIGFFK